MQRKEPVAIDVIVHELYPNTVPERLWMAKSNVEVGFKFNQILIILIRLFRDFFNLTTNAADSSQIIGLVWPC